MRNTTTVIVAAAAVLTFAGCSTPTEPPNTPKTTTATKKVEGTPSQRAALNAARNYLDTAAMSRKGLERQLTSEFDQHSRADAKWAIDHLNDVDWTEEAAEAARTYRDDMSMSLPAIEDQLASPSGDAFTPEEAKAAVDTIRAEEGDG